MLLEKATSDTLLLFDCYSAASEAPEAGYAMTEFIAACGWEPIAPEPGRFSFTNTLDQRSGRIGQSAIHNCYATK
jgi:hypothetical protein